MRVLFTTLAASGHIHPLVPVAQALAAVGHEVAFACAEDGRATIVRLGFRFFPAGMTLDQAMAELAPRRATDPAAEQPLWAGREAFGRLLPARMTRDLLAVCRAWEPDLIVREATELGGCLAAEILGLPHASVEVGTFFAAPWLVDFVGDRLVRLRASLGLPPDPELAAVYRHLHLSFVPPSFQDPAQPLPATAHILRTVVFDQSGEEALPDWVARLPERPTVYATLGTMSNDAPDLFRAIVAGLGDLPLNLIVTVGRDGDPTALGSPPENVRIARYIPQSLLFPHCDAVVCHAGWNTVLAALAHGLPMVLLPLDADQPWNAERCARLGAARVLAPAERTATAIAAATREALTDRRYRANATRLRDEIAALPGIDRAVDLLEELAAARRPLVAMR